MVPKDDDDDDNDDISSHTRCLNILLILIGTIACVVMSRSTR